MIRRIILFRPAIGRVIRPLGVIVYVPAASLKHQSGSREQTMNLATTFFVHCEWRVDEFLNDFKHVAAILTLILVQRHF
jgi:hypothetical protein